MKPNIYIDMKNKNIDFDKLNPEDIEFEEDDLWTKFCDNNSKPFPYETLMDVYKQLGINIEEHPRLKELVLAKKTEALKKTKKE